MAHLAFPGSEYKVHSKCYKSVQGPSLGNIGKTVYYIKFSNIASGDVFINSGSLWLRDLTALNACLGPETIIFNSGIKILVTMSGVRDTIKTNN